MISITVTRADGTKKNPDTITDPLILTAEAARARGQRELDATTPGSLIATTGYLNDDHVEPGAVVEVTDIEEQSYRGRVQRSAITISKSGNNFSATQSLEVFKP